MTINAPANTAAPSQPQPISKEEFLKAFQEAGREDGLHAYADLDVYDRAFQDGSFDPAGYARTLESAIAGSAHCNLTKWTEVWSNPAHTSKIDPGAPGLGFLASNAKSPSLRARAKAAHDFIADTVRQARATHCGKPKIHPLFVRSKR